MKVSMLGIVMLIDLINEFFSTVSDEYKNLFMMQIVAIGPDRPVMKDPNGMKLLIKNDEEFDVSIPNATDMVNSLINTYIEAMQKVLIEEYGFVNPNDTRAVTVLKFYEFITGDTREWTITDLIENLQKANMEKTNA